MKLHRFDPLSFVAGVLITLTGLVFLVPRTWGDMSWFIGRIASWGIPVIFLLLGLAVLIPALIPHKKEPEDSQAV